MGTNKGGPDKVTRESASILGTGIGEVHKTTIYKDGATYTGKGSSRVAADRQAEERFRKGHKDR